MINKNNILYNYYYASRLFFCIFIISMITREYKILLFWVPLLFFFRSKNIQLNSGSFISPSDGKITNIYHKNKNTIMNIYLSPFDHHYMIAPVDCEVISQKYIINNNESENLSITFRSIDKNYEFELQQIVMNLGDIGYLPNILYKNRCISFVKPGDILKQGEKYGLIRFGSCMKYIVPKNVFNKNNNIGDKLSLGQIL